MKMHVWMGFLPVSGRSVRVRRVDIPRTSILLEIDEISPSWFMGVVVLRGPDPVDFDDFGENSTISPFRFSGSARSLHENARVNGIHADVWSIGQGQARGHPTNLDFA